MTESHIQSLSRHQKSVTTRFICLSCLSCLYLLIMKKEIRKYILKNIDEWVLDKRVIPSLVRKEMNKEFGYFPVFNFKMILFDELKKRELMFEKNITRIRGKITTVYVIFKPSEKNTYIKNEGIFNYK